MQTVPNLLTQKKSVDPWTGSCLNFYNPIGKTLKQKFQPIDKWKSERNHLGTWPFGMLNQKTEEAPQNINLALFDYLGLSRHEEVLSAAEQVIRTHGISSSSSPSLNGRTSLSQLLEEKTARLLNKEICLLYPSGWAACYGAVAAIANSNDTILIDRFAHNCLATAAKSVTSDVQKFRHNDLEHLSKLLKSSREKNTANTVLIVLESLYSMNSTGPDFKGIMELANHYEAIVVIDTAHELGCYGLKGLGILEGTDISADNLIITGSFSKVFGTNGGFVAGPKYMHTHFLAFSPTYAYSSAMSPIQCVIILKSLDIAFSNEGDHLREALMKRSLHVRKQFIQNGFEIDGNPSAIIPVIIGEERKSREMFRHLRKEGLLVNLIEFPVVQRARSLFRLLLSPNHTFEELDRAVEIVCEAWESRS